MFHKALTRRWFLHVPALLLAISLATLPALGQLPARLTDQEFWKLAAELVSISREQSDQAVGRYFEGFHAQNL